MNESIHVKAPYSSSIETDYTLRRVENGYKLLPVVGLSLPGQRFENEHFTLSKSELSALKGDDGRPLYPGWVIDLVWPKFKTSAESFGNFGKDKYKKFGVEYRNYNNRTHEHLSLEAIEDLFLQIDEAAILDVDHRKTGLILSTCAFVNRRSKGTLKTDHLSQINALNNIAEILQLKPLFCVNEACSGFLASIMRGQQFLENQDDIDNIVIVTSEKLSNMSDFSDAAASIIFGDLTTATMITKKEVEGLKLLGGASCYYSCYMDENKHMVSMREGEEQILYIDDGARTDGNPIFRMNGGATYYQAIKEIPKAILLLAQHLDIKNMSQILCHQANQKILLELDEKIKADYPFSRVLVPISMDIGNVSSSTIPNLMHSILNKPDKVVSKFIETGNAQQSVDWKRGMSICMASIGVGVYIRSLMFVYE